MVRMPRWKPHDVRIEMAGYRPHRRRLKNSLNPDMIWNALLIGGAPYGLAIDVLSGAWDDFLQPGAVHTGFGADQRSSDGSSGRFLSDGGPPVP